MDQNDMLVQREAYARKMAKDDFEAGVSCNPARYGALNDSLFAQWYVEQYKIYISNASPYSFQQRLGDLRGQIKMAIYDVVESKGDTGIQGIDYEMGTEYCMGTNVTAVQLQGRAAYLILEGKRTSFSAIEIEELLRILIYLKQD